MRVISGKYKGRILKGFDIDGTRPTMDRVKESLFAMVQNDIKDAICLDLFAGSGSLGIEALSNGAKKCYFVDNGSYILKILKENLKGIDNAILIEKHYHQALKNITEKFDIIFLDPPYKDNFIGPAIKYILDYDLLNDDGLIICEYETEHFSCDLNIIKETKYGSKRIRIYRK